MPRIARALIEGREAWGQVDPHSFQPHEGDFGEGLAPVGDPIPLGEVVLLSPVQPRKLLMMLGNFLPEGESVRQPSLVPKLTPKLVSTVLGDGAEVVVPAFVTGPLWCEVEIAVVVGKEVREASRDEAREAIYGFTCFNDFTAAEFIPGDLFAAKSIETFACMGPWIATDLREDDVERGLSLVARVNGTKTVEASTQRMKFMPSEVISSVSRHVVLQPGDVIAMGTPQHCEIARGDLIEIEVGGVGTLRNALVSE